MPYLSRENSSGSQPEHPLWESRQSLMLWQWCNTVFLIWKFSVLRIASWSLMKNTQALPHSPCLKRNLGIPSAIFGDQLQLLSCHLFLITQLVYTTRCLRVNAWRCSNCDKGLLCMPNPTYLIGKDIYLIAKSPFVTSGKNAVCVVLMARLGVNYDENASNVAFVW